MDGPLRVFKLGGSGDSEIYFLEELEKYSRTATGKEV